MCIRDRRGVGRKERPRPEACLICSKTASTMGIIMEAVAVLEIHMDRNHVGSISPSITLDTQASTLV